MILTCYECETKFLIRAEDLGSQGRRVRCGNCSAVWFEKPAAPVVVAEEEQIVKAQKENLEAAVEKKISGVKPSLPAVYEPIAPPKWLKAAVIILVLANIGAFIFFNKRLIGQTSFYDMVGQYQTEGVAITDASILEGPERKGVKNYFVKWSVVNNSKEKRELPSRRIKVLNKDYQVISQGSDKKELMIDAGKTIPVEANKVPADGRAKYVMIEIGNPYELMQR